MADSQATASASYDAQQVLELQHQLDIIQEQLRKTAANVQSIQVNAKRCEVAIETMDECAEGTNFYKQIARVFVKEERDPLRESLKKQMEESVNGLPKLLEVKEHVTAKLREITKQLVEAQKQAD